MNVVDSCGWLEYFANRSNAGFFAPALEATESLLVPSLSVVEVCKRVALQRGEQAAHQAAEFMAQGQIVALAAALCSARRQLPIANCRWPMADGRQHYPAHRPGAPGHPVDAGRRPETPSGRQIQGEKSLIA